MHLVGVHPFDGVSMTPKSAALLLLYYLMGSWAARCLALEEDSH